MTKEDVEVKLKVDRCSDRVVGNIIDFIAERTQQRDYAENIVREERFLCIDDPNASIRGKITDLDFEEIFVFLEHCS